MTKGMTVKKVIFPKYLVMDILPVAESLASQYDDETSKEILDECVLKYVDIHTLKLDNPRLQFVFDISDSKNVYLSYFDCYDGYKYKTVRDVCDNMCCNYHLRLKFYPSSTMLRLVDENGHFIFTKAIERLPTSFIEVTNGVVFDNYLDLELQSYKVLNYSNPEFFADIEEIFNR